MDESGRLDRPAGFLPPERRHDPLQVATALVEAGADELQLHAPPSGTERLPGVLARLATISIPIAVAAEPAGLDGLEALLTAGATRVSMEDTALGDPDFIRACAARFGSAAVSVGVQARRDDGYWRVVRGAKRRPTEWDVITWARVIEAQGGGELILGWVGPTDGPFGLELLRSVSEAVAIPVMAAGETSAAEELFDALMIGDAAGVIVAASALTDATAVRAIKRYLADHGLKVRQD